MINNHHFLYFSERKFFFQIFYFYSNNSLASVEIMNTTIQNQMNHITTPSLTSGPESYSDYVDPNFPRWFIIVLFVIGIFGNFLSLAVFNKMKVRQNSTYIYLAVLCLVDITVTILGLGDMIILFYFNQTLRNESVYLCRIHTFLLYTFTHWSSFILGKLIEAFYIILRVFYELNQFEYFETL